MDSHHLTFTDLPNDPLLHILSYLSYKDLARCTQVCHRLKDLTVHDSLWKRQYRLYHEDISRTESIGSWRESFLGWYSDYGRYTDCYLPIRKAWRQIETYMTQNCPGILDTIDVGASEADLNRVEEKLGVRLPSSLRFMYRIHNGQTNDQPFGLLGGIQNYNHKRSERLLPLNDIETLHRVYIDQYKLPAVFVPLSFCAHSYTSQILLAGEADFHGLPPGSVFYTSKSKANQDIFITGESIQDWFCRYAQELEDGEFSIDHENILKFYSDPTFVATTDHVRISVATAFVPEMSHVNPRPSQNVHAYRVTLSMDAEAPPSAACQLETRRWVIKDEEGHEEVVQGPGVIGEYPVIKPGVTWSYISCTHFKTDSGVMSGSYTMRKLRNSGATFDAEVPAFHMKVPKYITLPREVSKSWKY